MDHGRRCNMARETSLRRSAVEPHKLSCSRLAKELLGGLWTKQKRMQFAIHGVHIQAGALAAAEAGDMSVSFSILTTTTERPYRMHAGAVSLLDSSGHAFRC
jgi:hypothetical protein